MKFEWQLWECVSFDTLVALAKYQKRNHRNKLQIIINDTGAVQHVSIESLAEIDHLMRQAPKHQKRVK